MTVRFALAPFLAALTGSLLLGSTLPGDSAAQDEKMPSSRALRLASDAWPPFTDRPSKPAVAIELVNSALARIGVEAKTFIRDDGTLIADLRAGNFDGSVALWRNDERELFLHFSRPYLENRLVLVGRKGTDVDAPNLAALKGRRVAIVGDYAYGEEIERARRVEFIKGPSVSKNLRKLLEGSVDYVLMDELVAHQLFEGYGERAKKSFQVGTKAMIRRTLHLAFRRDLPNAQDILARFDVEIRKMMADGTYNRVLQVDWLRTDVDGDGTPELVLDGTQAGTNAPGTSYGVILREPKPDLPPGPNKLERYYIEGNLYEGWDRVPSRYKIPVSREEPSSPSIILFEF